MTTPPPNLPESVVTDEAALMHPLVYYAEAARSQLGAIRPDDPDEADFWDGLTAVAEALTSSVIELPELPAMGVTETRNDLSHDGDYEVGIGYTADQMRTYAADAVRAANARAEGLEADARRYRFIRNDPPSSFCVRIDREGCKAIYTDGTELDAAIDAAQAVRSEASEGDKS